MVANECNGQWGRALKVLCVETSRKHQSKPTGIILRLQVFDKHSACAMRAK
jgi:hypothetical protein